MKFILKFFTDDLDMEFAHTVYERFARFGIFGDRACRIFFRKFIKPGKYFILIALFLFLPLPYPFLPIHATLISTATIGIPSVLLAFFGGNKVVGGNFVRDVIVRAIPYGILVAVNILSAHWIGRYFHLARAEISTLCVMVTAVVAIQVLINVCRPFRIQTRLIVGLVIAIFALAFAFLQRFFLLWWRPGWPVAISLGCSFVFALLLHYGRLAWLRKPWRRLKQMKKT
jgi:hypothetical protein